MSSTSSDRFNPFPGLRPFRDTETHLFFGRREQTDELLVELERCRFVAVLGASGSGKSSLVHAGLLPALYGGFSVRVGSHVRVATFRPGRNPIRNLSQALIEPHGPESAREDPLIALAKIEARLRRSGLGLADEVRLDRRFGDGRLLVVVDQFEELFRFRATTDDAARWEDTAAFVRLLIEATQDDSAPVDVVVTMRSDFIGECSQYRDLPETMSRGLYLVPRLTRSQLREVITAPVAMSGTSMTPRLVQRLLNDTDADPDVLPVLQHALMRTWDIWAHSSTASDPIDLEHYEASGGLDDALSRHADEAFDSMDDGLRQVAEVMFKRLTELGADHREVRRPSPLVEIAAVADATSEEVSEVVGNFEEQGRSFVAVSGDDVVDISHESLIRQWPRLRTWVRQEAASREVYLRLVSAAVRWHRGEAALLRDPDLQIAATWWETNQPNEEWAKRYSSSFREAESYLARSKGAARRRRNWAMAGVATLALVAVVSALVAVLFMNLKTEAQRQRRIAVSQQLAAQSVSLGSEGRVVGLLTALEALQATETDGVRLPVAEQALRRAMRDPLGLRLPNRAGQRGHNGPINRVAFSSDGTFLATASGDSTVLLWSVTGPEADPVPLEGNHGEVTALAFSPEGNQLATGSDDGSVLLWDLQQSDPRPTTLAGHALAVTALAFSRDGRRLASASIDNDAKLWTVDAAAGERLLRKLDGHTGFVLALAFSPDGSRLVTGGGDDLALVWTVDDMEAPPLVLRHSDDVTSVAFSQIGLVATGSKDSSVKVWALTDVSSPKFDVEHGGPVNTVAFSPDGRWLASGSGDETARVVSVSGDDSEGEQIVLLHTGIVETVVFDEDSNWLATSSRDNTARLYHVDEILKRNLEPIVLAGHEGPVTTLDFSKDSRWLATGSRDDSARLWDLDYLSTRPAILRHEDSADSSRAEMTSVAFSPDGLHIAAGTATNTAHLWNVDDLGASPITFTHKPLQPFPNAGITALAFSPDGRRLATGSGDQTVKLWNSVEPGNEPIKQHDFGAFVTALAFSPDGRWLAVAAKDPDGWLWDMDDPQAKPRPLHGHVEQLTSLGFSPDGSWLATGSWDRTVRLWRVEDLDAEPKVLEGHEGTVISLAFEPDGRRLATGAEDNKIIIWNVTGNPTIDESIDTGETVASMVFSPDEALLVTAIGQSIQLWDVSDSGRVGEASGPTVLDDHTGTVNAVTFESDGRWFASASSDNTVRVWQPLEELTSQACVAAGRNLTDSEWQTYLPDQPYAKTCEQWAERP